MKNIRNLLLVCTALMLVGGSVLSQSGIPPRDYAIHRVGKFWTTVNNNGIIGNYYGFPMPDVFKAAPSFYYPQFSRTSYGSHIGLWIGGVVGKDTLVSATIDEAGRSEFFPDHSSIGYFESRSINPNSPNFHFRAKAEEQFNVIYVDTFTSPSLIPANSFDARGHKPLNLTVVQTSYAWSPEYAEDFVIIDYKIYNMTPDTIRSMYAGMYYSGFIWNPAENPWPIPDEYAGYLYSWPYEFEGLGEEVMKIAYVLDRDGRSQQFSWDLIPSCAHAFGIAPLRTPRGAVNNNFNWWNHQYGSWYDWGPRMAETDRYPLRQFYSGLGTPKSDRNRYYLMSKPEKDYPGWETYVDHTADGWLPRFRGSRRLAWGHQPQFLTSFGPFRLGPYEADTLTIAIAIGKNVHTNQQAYREFFDPNDPSEYANYLKFDNLVNSIRWAKLVYDNPGIDTDGDGDSGRSISYFDPVVKDTVDIFYEGDGVPDLRGATPPPAPNIRLETHFGEIRVRWNGFTTENYIDPMTLTKDFEGYRVYISRSRNPEEAVLLSSYDREDYRVLRWNTLRGKYDAIGIPLTRDSLQAVFEADLDPAIYSHSSPYLFDNSYYYFEPVDYNAYDLSDPRNIHKVYPDAVLDTADRDEEGRVRYYEYEYTISGLLPSVPYYVSVTGHDFGHPARELAPMESSIEGGMVEVYALERGEDAHPGGKLDVYVFPNPYRVDDNYYIHGFENRYDEVHSDKARGMYFANLPNKCTISVYSLDGDLIKRMEHDLPEDDGSNSIHRFDLVSRNREPVVTGLYYWIVESEYGTQMGKFVILK